MRCRLQPALADAGSGAFGPQQLFCTLFYVDVFNLAGLRQPSHAVSAAPTGQQKAVDGLKLNFAGPTTYQRTQVSMISMGKCRRLITARSASLMLEEVVSWSGFMLPAYQHCLLRQNLVKRLNGLKDKSERNSPFNSQPKNKTRFGGFFNTCIEKSRNKYITA